MIKAGTLSIVEWAILIYCAWNASDLLQVWRNTPSNYYSWLAFLIWISPIIIPIIVSLIRKKPIPSSQPILMGIALFISLIGVVTDLNVIKHLGFAVALAALLPFSWRLIPWLLLAISWMPALGYLIKNNLYDYSLVIRLTLAIIGALIMFSLKNPEIAESPKNPSLGS